MTIEKNDLYSVIPHRGRMMLLTRITGYSLEDWSLEAEYHINEACIFFDNELSGVPSWAGFEFMAQAISAFVGIKIRELGEEPKMGFILSVSSMKFEIPVFKTGDIAQIEVRKIGEMDNVYTFEGKINVNGCKVLEGKLTVMEIAHEQGMALIGGQASNG
jgi:predicted hotdog family 3-hydroxylacyl-ACP dehydratase